ncbi:hypothetical protein MBLNU230_g6321t1 [Neophaeotheca triangularis]
MTLRHQIYRRASIAHARPWQKRALSSAVLDRLKDPVQAYISNSRDAYLNLSIEHYLLQNAHVDSKVLFMYVNRPSIIIGRNQNPWLEANIALLKAANGNLQAEPPGLGNVDLVRRRSGGGTVFHDEGNVNWTVICPTEHFTRDKHAETVVQALRRLGVDRARVNKRHDIVLDQGSYKGEVQDQSTHNTPYRRVGPDGPRPLKVSGSAYKLTRARALHHGTCLLNSPNLNVIPDYLHSPSRPFLQARGVDSVSSPVGNILVNQNGFIHNVREEFARMYETKHHAITDTTVGEEWLEVDSIRKGYEELKSLDWTFLQTPQFTLQSWPSGFRPQEAIPRISLVARYGQITEMQIESTQSSGEPTSFDVSRLIGKQIHRIDDWASGITNVEGESLTREKNAAVRWLETMLPTP